MEATTAERTIDEIDEEELGLQEPYVEGHSGQLSLGVGGRSPDKASVKLRGGSIVVEGQFEKGDEVTLVINARIAEVHFVDRIDEHGVVTSTERRHFARMTGVRRA